VYGIAAFEMPGLRTRKTLQCIAKVAEAKRSGLYPVHSGPKQTLVSTKAEASAVRTQDPGMHDYSGIVNVSARLRQNESNCLSRSGFPDGAPLQ
jgi:hypothetical protein